MAWIKRNLFFVIASVVALLLVGAGGWYFYSAYSTEGQSADKIAMDYDTLHQLNQQNPHPGKPGGTNDNVQAAKDQRASLRAWIDSTRPYFQPVKPMANLANFPTELDNSVLQLKSQARQNGVSIPTGYYFTFLAQKNMLAIPRDILPQLAARLGEVKIICGILFDAKVNNLESIRREVVSPDDTNGPDYLSPDQRTTVTPLAELTPYEVTFDCFSGELASVLGNFAASPYGLVVQSMQVTPAEGAGSVMGNSSAAPAAYAGGYPGPGGGGGRFYNPGNMGAPPPRPMTLAPPAPNGRPVKFLTDNKLRITLLIDVVKPKAGK